MKEEVNKNVYFVDTFITAELVKICKKYIQETGSGSSKYKRSYMNILNVLNRYYHAGPNQQDKKWSYTDSYKNIRWS